MDLVLIDRERSNGRTEWIVGRSPCFISHELWLSRRPYYVNERLHKFPAGHIPTLEDIDGVLVGTHV